jgi:hypothetical protein
MMLLLLLVVLLLLWLLLWLLVLQQLVLLLMVQLVLQKADRPVSTGGRVWMHARQRARRYNCGRPLTAGWESKLYWLRLRRSARPRTTQARAHAPLLRRAPRSVGHHGGCGGAKAISPVSAHSERNRRQATACSVAVADQRTPVVCSQTRMHGCQWLRCGVACRRIRPRKQVGHVQRRAHIGRHGPWRGRGCGSKSCRRARRLL